MDTDIERLSQVVNDPNSFLYRFDEDDWVVIKKKLDIAGLSYDAIIESDSHYMKHVNPIHII